MKSTWQRSLALVSLLASALALGCADAADPSRLLAPGEASYGKNGSGSRLKLVARSEAGVVSVPTDYEVIGPAGGRVGDGAYGVVVPQGAVEEPTLFVISGSVEYPTNAVIKASATSCPSGDADECYDGGRGVTNNIGADGFKKPVELYLGFNPGRGNKAWTGVSIVWIRPDGEIVRVPTHVMKAQKQLRGLTNHFSLYGIGWP